MNDNQYMRWGLPGVVFLFVVFSFWTITPGYDLKVFSDSALVSALAIIIGAGIPIGYIIYQVYFAVVWWTLPNEIARLTIKDVPDAPELEGDDFGHKYMKLQRKQWPHVENFWYKRIYDLGYDKAGFFRERHYHLLSIFHSLGSTITAIILGNFSSFILFRFILKYTAPINWWYLIGLVGFWMATAYIFFINRRYLRYNILCFQNYVLKNIK